MASPSLPLHEQIEDPTFRAAVDLLDHGDVEGLRRHLVSHPDLVRQRVRFDDSNHRYFSHPTLLEFIAENPVRHDRLPPNIVDVAQTILDTPGGRDRASLDSTLELVSSGRVAREHGLQVPLIERLCRAGADPDRAMPAALAHGEFQAVAALLAHGAVVDLTVAAATGRTDAVRRLLAGADGESRHRGLALAAQHGHADAVRALVEAGEDPDRYNPVGCHAHSTPLHQAAVAGHAEVVRLLVERGARLDLKDTVYHGTPLDWAGFAGRSEIEDYLRSRTA